MMYRVLPIFANTISIGRLKTFFFQRWMVNGVGGPNMELAVSHVVAEKQRGRASVTVLLRQTAGKSARASPLQARSVTRRSANKVTLANEASTRNATVYCIYKTNRNKSFPSKVPSAYPPPPHLNRCLVQCGETREGAFLSGTYFIVISGQMIAAHLSLHS